MRVRELMVKLSKVNPFAEVAIAKDKEGNSFCLLSDRVEENLFIENNPEVRETIFTPEQVNAGRIYDEYGNVLRADDIVECVILAPKN